MPRVEQALQQSGERAWREDVMYENGGVEREGVTKREEEK